MLDIHKFLCIILYRNHLSNIDEDVNLKPRKNISL